MQLAALRGANENLTRAWLNQDVEARVRASREQALAERQALFEQNLGAAVQAVIERTEQLERQLSGPEEYRNESGMKVDDALRFLTQRIEFVRREMLFELQHGHDKASERSAIAPRITNPQRVEAVEANELKLNVGCGHIALEGYVNVDFRALPGVDIVADAGNIGLEPGSAAEISSSHLLEHFPDEALKRRILPHWAKLLRSGGRLRAVVPDGDAMIARCAAGNYSFEDFREVLFGSQDYQGDFHYNLFTPDSLKQTLEQAGFESIEIPRRGTQNGQCFEFEICATKP